MIIPGINRIGYLRADTLPDGIALRYCLNDVPLNTQLTVNELCLQGEAECSIEEANPNNGLEEKVSLTFRIEHRINNRHRLAFVVTRNDGHSYLIGTKESVPSVTQNDTVASPDAVNAVEVRVEMSAVKAWIPLESLDYTEGTPTPFIQWREATEQEIDDMIDNIEEPATSINAKILITLRLLDRAFKRLWQKLSTDIPAHTHTTDQVKMADNPSKTLTAELEKIRKIAAAGL